MPGIGIITNPHSKLNKRDPERIKLLGYVLGEKGTIEVTQTLEHLFEVALRFKSNKIEVLAINGGDGTISRTLTAFKKAYGDEPLPKIALLKGGTMNVLAVNLGIKGSPERILAYLLEQVSLHPDLPPTRLRSIEVEGNLGFVYADGTCTYLLEEFYKDKSGVVGALWLGFKLILSSFVNGKLFERIVRQRKIAFLPDQIPVMTHQSLGVLAATIRKLPLGLPFFGLAGRNPQQFQAISVNSGRKKLLWHLPFIMLQNKERESLGKISYCCEKLTITSDEKITYTLDGEIYEAQQQSIDINLGPEFEFVNL